VVETPPLPSLRASPESAGTPRVGKRRNRGQHADQLLVSGPPANPDPRQRLGAIMDRVRGTAGAGGNEQPRDASASEFLGITSAITDACPWRDPRRERSDQARSVTRVGVRWIALFGFIRLQEVFSMQDVLLGDQVV
jgi:hypothetical protein